MQSPRITEAASSLLGGEGRHETHALVRHAGVEDEIRHFVIQHHPPRSCSGLASDLVA